MASISSPGVGSGLDVNSIVQQLLQAERAPVENRLNRREATYEAELSAYGALKSSLSTFQGSLSKLTDYSSFQGLKVSSSNSGAVSATASDSATEGSYNLDVTALAKAQTLASSGFSDTTSALGSGTLSFQFGTYDSDANSFTANDDKSIQAVDISGTDGSLLGIRDAVNEAEIGVTASIVNDGSGYRLIFNSDDTGAANSLKVSVSDDDGTDTDTAGLSQLAYDPTATVGAGKNLSEAVTAQDALFTINGLSITSDSNEVSSAIDGVTFNLKETTDGAPVNITVNEDTAGVRKNVESFVDSYNDLMGTIKQLTKYDAETGEAGILLGDSVTRGITSQVRNIVSSAVSGLDGAYRSLADLGITTQSGGTLALDSTKLSEALESDYSVVGKLFASAGTVDDSLIDFVSAGEATEVGDYAVNISQLATQGSYSGGALNSLTVDGDNDTFNIEVDGVSAAIALTQKTYASGDELAAEIEGQINAASALQDAGISVAVAFSGGALEITSSRYGSESSVDITSVDTNTATTLGLNVGAGTAGVDVAGTIGGVAASGSGRFLTGVGAAEGLKLEVTGGATGDRGSAVFSRGVADRLSSLLDGYLESDSLIEARTEGLNNRIDDINDQRADLARRLEMLEQRYTKQFAALDAMMGQMQSTSDYLSGQLASLPYNNME